MLAIFGPDYVLPDGQASHYGYGQAFATIGLVILAIILVPLGMLLTMITSSIVCKRCLAADRDVESS